MLLFARNLGRTATPYDGQEYADAIDAIDHNRAWRMCGVGAELHAQAIRDQLTILQRSTIAESSHEAVAAVNLLRPGASTPRHSHPGVMVGFVSEGKVTIQQDGQPPATFIAGQSFIIPAGVAHRSSNSSKVAARMFVTFVVDKTQPFAARADRD